MTGDGLKASFSNVAKLQEQFFPRKVLMGTLTESSRNEEAKKEDPNDGYTCHRLQPPTPAEEPKSASPKPSLVNGLIAPELYQVVREACAQQNVKWPVECQVLHEPVQHIEDWPLYPEAFYQHTGRELRPQPVGDEMGRIVYQYYPTSTVNYFTRSCVGGNKQLSRDVRLPLTHPDDTTLQFESRFESGNLAKAVQISECYYELHLRADLYTARHTQWFYFSVSNTRKDVAYRLSIVNLCKGDSLYNHGMRPLLYSTKEAELHNVGWRRCASNIVYFRNQDCESGCFDSDEEGDEEAPSFTLTFNVIFPHDHDTVFLAHCFPYTYSLLQQHLLSIQNDPFRSGVCRQRVLCRSLAGNPVYLLTITGHDAEDEHKKKRAVVLSARVHPGETPASWMMKGVLDFLTSDHPKAVELRRQFVFKIIPMVNPDGVIVGNHRCSLVGRDLNRQYKMVVKEMFPAVWHAKAMVRRLMDENGVVMFCDFHAHSRKNNIFLYGCENRRSQENHLREQIFPLLLHYNAGDKFSFRNCKFRVQRCKEGTARVVVWMMGVLHSYTLESSFGGASEGQRVATHFSILDFLSMGRQFSESLCEYFDAQPGKEKLRNRLWSRLVKKGSNADEPMAVDLSDTNSSSDDSDRHTQTRVRRKRLARTTRKRAPGLRSGMSCLAEDHSSFTRKSEKLERRGKHRPNSNPEELRHVPGKDVDEYHLYDELNDRLQGGGSPLKSADSSHLYSTSALLKSLVLRKSHVKGERNVVSLYGGHATADMDDKASASENSPRGSPFKSKANSRMKKTASKCAVRSSPLQNRKNRFVSTKNTHDVRGERAYSPSNYIDHMGELMSTRLALSDNEGDCSSKFWLNGSSSPFWDKSSSPSSSVTRLTSLRLDSKISSRLDSLEPVVAKTRLHEPRALQRPPRSPVSLKTNQGSSRMLTRSKINSNGSFNNKSKKKFHSKSLFHLDSEDDPGSPALRRQRMRQSSFEDDHHPKKERVKSFKNVNRLSLLKSATGEGSIDASSIQDDSSHLDEKSSSMSPSHPANPQPSQEPRKISRKSRKEDAVPLNSPGVDAEQLCADIATCDTLFLDIGAHETPELKAARNLKGRIKKKKSSGSGGIPAEQEALLEERLNADPNGNISQDRDVTGASQDGVQLADGQTKVKKKIKIVIGKKSKLRTGRKKAIQGSLIEDLS